MNSPTKSYLKVAYDLRPAKQVERRMIVDALHKLARAGFDISSYQYTGMGSIHFVDFVLFHKLLGIRDMWNVERDLDIERRVRFNKPFNFIKIKMKSVGEVIPELSRDRKHLIWLDYDDIISGDILRDVSLASSVLSVGSVLLITIDIEPPGLVADGPKEWRRHYENEASEYVGSLKLRDYSESKLPQINKDILQKAIQAGLLGRGARFLPLFHFIYRDGHKMLTVGGMFVTETEERTVRVALANEQYVRFDLHKSACEVSVPIITRKERLYLDAAMPCRDNWLPTHFEFSAELARAYGDIYRFFPTYAELLL